MYAFPHRLHPVARTLAGYTSTYNVCACISDNNLVLTHEPDQQHKICGAAPLLAVAAIAATAFAMRIPAIVQMSVAPRPLAMGRAPSIFLQILRGIFLQIHNLRGHRVHLGNGRFPVAVAAVAATALAMRIPALAHIRVAPRPPAMGRAPSIFHGIFLQIHKLRSHGLLPDKVACIVCIR